MEQPQLWGPQSVHSGYTIDDRGTLHIGPKQAGSHHGVLGPDSDAGSSSSNTYDDDDNDLDVGGWDDEDFMDEHPAFAELSPDDRAVFMESMREYYACLREADRRDRDAGGDEDDDDEEIDIDLDEDETFAGGDWNRPRKKMKVGLGGGDLGMQFQAGPSSKGLLGRRVSNRKRRTRKLGGKQVKSMGMGTTGRNSNGVTIDA